MVNRQYYTFFQNDLKKKKKSVLILATCMHLSVRSLELFYTERAHLRMLKVLDCVFCQRLNRDGILPPEDIKHIFINLEEILQLHGNNQLAAR